jgi:Ras family protein A
MLRDIDQPYIFGIKTGNNRLQFEFYDTSCPDNWRTLDPDAVVICFDINQRLSLINMQRYVSVLSIVPRSRESNS